jgi:hypothetical protein
MALRLRLAGAGPASLTFARSALAWLDRTLLLPSGLYADHIDRHGIDRTIWSYNQGAPAGAHALLHRATDEPVPLVTARDTSVAALAHLRADRLWSHPPVFNAIWFRNLLALDALDPIPDVRGRLEAYLDRAWREARGPATGLFTAGDIGSYDRTPTIDHAGLVQLFALRGWPRERLLDVC